LGARAFSATALERFAPCPYRFFLGSILRLSPRQEPAAIEQLDALSRGRLIHEVQHTLLRDLRARGALPITAARVALAYERLDVTLDAIAGAYHERLAPAIERVWSDAVEEIRGDMREWIARQSHDPSWVPQHFELAFGLPLSNAFDASSTPDPVALASGVTLRGAIDLVESRGATLRATDHKTGRLRAEPGSVVAGGESLQPLLYALALEHLFPERDVAAGRLYHCTSRGEFAEHEVPLDDRTRAAARRIMAVIEESIQAGMLPAAPTRGACEHCDYASVCGPREEQRTARKKPALTMLQELRDER
jgi:ATP-dependent helicase/DNAse subunit B